MNFSWWRWKFPTILLVSQVRQQKEQIAPSSGVQAIMQDVAVISGLERIFGLCGKGKCSNINLFGASFEGIHIADEVEIICVMVTLASL